MAADGFGSPWTLSPLALLDESKDVQEGDVRADHRGGDGFVTAAGAQEPATGKWTGNYMRRTNQGLQGTGLTINIDSVHDGVL